MLEVWITLGLAVVAASAGLAVAVARGLLLWRSLRRLRRSLADDLGRVARAGEHGARSPGELGAHGEALRTSLERLDRSLAQARVLCAAVRDVLDVLGWVAAAVPRK